jgi:protein-L-isoaspartate O-methyltransferase
MAARLLALAGLDAAWQDAFAEVPREAFLPPVVWRRAPAGAAVRIEQDNAPEDWWAMVYDERRTIVTQLDGGAADGPGNFTSSSTMPLVMAQMLALLPAEGRVLEVGTGTGYNSALLAHRYGPRNVVTVEYDAQLAARAEAALQQAGYPVTVLRGDGTARIKVDGTFDAILATCAIRQLPVSWLEQCPAGRIVLPYATRWSDVAALVLDTQGGRAEGRFYPGFVFMDARTQAPADDRPPATVGGSARVSQLAPAEVTWQASNAAFAVGLLMPGVDYRTATGEDGIERVTVWDGRGSWAVVDQQPGDEGWAVREQGSRRLWAEVEAAYRQWVSWRRPSPDRFSASVSTADDRMAIWLDEPARVVAHGALAGVTRRVAA